MDLGLKGESMRVTAGPAHAHGRAGLRVNAIDPGLTLHGGSTPGVA